MSETILVPVREVCSVRFDGVSMEWVDRHFYHEDPDQILRVLYEDGLAVAECACHGIARRLLEDHLRTGVDADWYLEPGQSLDMSSKEDDEWDDEDTYSYNSEEEDEAMGRCMRCRRDYLDHRGRCQYCNEMEQSIFGYTPGRYY
jgi:hypothetical protein